MPPTTTTGLHDSQEVDANPRAVLDASPPLGIGYEEAAAYLHLSKRAVARLVAENEIAFVRVGRRIWFRTVDLDAFLERARVPARSEEAVQSTALGRRPTLRSR